MIDCLENCYIFTVYMGPAYTEEQLIERAHMQAKRCGLFPAVNVEYDAFQSAHQNWSG